MTLLDDRADARNSQVALSDEADFTILPDIEKLERDRSWWTAEAVRIGTDWASVVDAALELMIASGVLEPEPGTDTMSSWDAPSWRQAAVEYHHDLPSPLAIE